MRFKTFLSIRDYQVRAMRHDGSEPAVSLRTSNDGMILYEYRGFKRMVMHEFGKPVADVKRMPGGDRYLFRRGTKPLWDIVITDLADGTRWYLMCRNELDARSIKHWCDVRVEPYLR